MSEQVFIIAEVGSVHDGSFGNAGRLIDLAAELGVDAVKFQTHLPAAETLADAPAPSYFRGEPRFEYFKPQHDGGSKPESGGGLTDSLGGFFGG